MGSWTIPGSVVVGLLLANALPAGQTPPPKDLPYTAVHDPQFLRVSDATFMKDDDRVIGLMSGKVAKAYPGRNPVAAWIGGGPIAERSDRHYLVIVLQHGPRVQGRRERPTASV